MRIGVDVGGTTVKIGFIDNKEFVLEYQVNTKCETLFDDVLLSIKDNMNKLNLKEEDIEIIGFGLPGLVVDNFIVRLPNVGLKNVDLNKVVKKYFNEVKIKSTNDANAAALGEAVAGNVFNAYMITLGTGVGGGYINSGKVIDGAHSCCGEIGHMYIDSIHEFECTCGLKGCLETVTSATGITRLAKYYYNDYKTTLDKDNMTAKDVIDSARNNEELGVFVLDLVSKYLGIALANIAVTCDVEVFYIGGGVSHAGDILIDKINYYFKKYAHFGVKDTVIKQAKLKNQAGMLGAAYLA